MAGDNDERLVVEGAYLEPRDLALDLRRNCDGSGRWLLGPCHSDEMHVVVVEVGKQRAARSAVVVHRAGAHLDECMVHGLRGDRYKRREK